VNLQKEDEEKAVAEMKTAGVKVLTSEEFLK
jgi:hypothetical protein